MGLAAAKNKRRLGTDPNGTRWSRNTDTFGHKILRAHGWQPGQFLGAQEGAHTHLHSDASASHIRVVLKEDNLGLGAKRNNGDECVGLDAFQLLLGRLNGKSEVVLEKEQAVRDGVRLTLYADRKWGPMNFVSGGLLVGDDMQELDPPQGEATRSEKPDVAAVALAGVVETEVIETSTIQVKETTPGPDNDKAVAKKRSKKRKADSDEQSKERRKEKKSKRRKTDEAQDDTSDILPSKKRKDKKSRRSREGESDTSEKASTSKKRRKDKEVDNTQESTTEESVACDDDAAPKDSSKKSKKTKDKGQNDEKATKSSKKSSKKRRRKEQDDGEAATKSETLVDSTPANAGVSTPVGSGYSTPEAGVSARLMARRRFIAQKRLAFADPQTLNQIFMIKS